MQRQIHSNVEVFPLFHFQLAKDPAGMIGQVVENMVRELFIAVPEDHEPGLSTFTTQIEVVSGLDTHQDEELAHMKFSVSMQSRSTTE